MAAPGTQLAVLSTLPDLQNFLSPIPQDSTLYIDLEGKNLSRNGTLSTMTMLVHSTGMTGLIDIQTLGNAAFIMSKPNGKTLKDILEDETPKCFWDVRNDADALWAHHQIRLKGITDIQLLENASRAGDRTYVRGLDACVRQDLSLNFMELNRWIKTKKDIRSLMAQDIFTRRPLDDRAVQYCANDVARLPALQNVYYKRMSSEWRVKVLDESARRVADACRLSYDPHSELKKLGPWCSQSDRNVLTMNECQKGGNLIKWTKYSKIYSATTTATQATHLTYEFKRRCLGFTNGKLEVQWGLPHHTHQIPPDPSSLRIPTCQNDARSPLHVMENTSSS